MNHADPAEAPAPKLASNHAIIHSFRVGWRVIWVRLRFVIVVATAVVIVSQFELISTYFSKWIDGLARPELARQAVSGDTEYYCPMDPGVVSDWPTKCGVCNMTLVRRSRGEMGPLPEGVLARMQASPYRLHLGGIRTVPVAYQGLTFDVEAPATVIATPGRPMRVRIEITIEDVPMMKCANKVRLVIGERRASGRVVSVEAEQATGAVATIELGGAYPDLIDGGRLVATVAIPASELEPFRSMPVGPPPWRSGEPRFVYMCPAHPAVVQPVAGTCPRGGEALERHLLGSDERWRWRCVAHPECLSPHDDDACPECGAAMCEPAVVHFRPQEMVLAIPESAVIDTGRRRVVYVESMTGTFDAVEVRLGPRCGVMFPVIAGVAPGQRVVSQGAFLVDAETRLNPGAAVAYFGASNGSATTQDASASAQFSSEERAAIDRQATCPVTGKKLGSMGAPYRVELQGHTLYLCCEGCEEQLRAAPEKYLAAGRDGASRGSAARRDRP